MPHGLAVAPRFKVSPLELEVPLGRAVSIIDQHEVRTLLQAFGLHLHRFLVLADEGAREDFEGCCQKRYAGKYVPGSAEVQAAVLGVYGCYGGAAREPFAAAMNLLKPHVRQHELDSRSHRVAIYAEQFVRAAIRRRLVGADAKSVRDGLKDLFLLLDAVPAAPPPSLVHKRSVCGVHEADNPVIDMHWKVCRKAHDPVMSAKNG